MLIIRRGKFTIELAGLNVESAVDCTQIKYSVQAWQAIIL